ncbi:MAG: 3-dehydroquinate synthase [Cytophagaceae bacterium]|jgi:3-dehydroquinate synthase|nr:3-dehydroquinate synthase [Cytophagaceae bacterium]
MRTLHQTFAVPFQFPVHFTSGLFKIDNPTLSDTLDARGDRAGKKALVVVERQLLKHFPLLLNQLALYMQVNVPDLQYIHKTIIFEGGERIKNDTGAVQELLKTIHEQGIDRQSFVLCIGGGAILDMAGYATSIAHRGIRLIRIPTTVLSQNDSGVGVKNSINAFDKKNFLGCFTPPFAVINDFDFLTTLDDRDWRGGISEAIKVALIKDASFFESIQRNAQDLAHRSMIPMQQLIHRCAEMHLQHIASGDPFEMGSSRPLDFGHWAAHKLESMTSYQLRHGEAVAIGICLDAAYSFLQGRITSKEFEAIFSLFRTLGFTLFIPEMKRSQDLIEGLNEFREHLGGRLTIMLLDRIGKGVEVNEMDQALLVQALQLLEKYQHQDFQVECNEVAVR